MKIDEIKKSLKYKNYLYDGTIDIDTIKTTESYSFICDRGHIFNSTPQNVIKSFGEISCPICSNHRVLLGYNDMWTTAPELAKYLENEEDGYTHTRESNQKLKWKCPVCGYIHEGDTAPDACPQCKVPGEKFQKVEESQKVFQSKTYLT